MLEAGLPASMALWRLLALKGREEGYQAFLDAHWQGPERMAETLSSLGIQARPAQVEDRDLRYLDRPTLVELKDGSWAILDDPLAFAGRCTGRVLDLAPALPPGPTLWARLQALFLQRRQGLLTAAAATLLLQVLALTTPAITALVMDRALPDGARSLLGLVMAGLFLTTLHQVGLGWVRDRTVLFIGTRVAAAAERGFLEHLLACPFPFLQGRTLGDLMQAFGGFSAARELLPLKTVGVFLNGSMAFVYLAAMLFLLPLPTLLILMVTAVLALLTLGTGRLQARFQARQVEAEASERSLLIELVGGIGTLKGAGAEAKGLARWRWRYRKVLALELGQGRVHLWSGLAMGLLNQALAAALLIWGGTRLLDGTLKAGQLFAFLQLSAGFMQAVLAMVSTWITLMILKPQLAKAQEILAVAPEPRPARPQAAPGPVPLVMEDVWFRYGPGLPWVLKGYDLRVAAGERRALEGPSGFGKTTVLRLLAGLYVPERGSVLVAGSSPASQRHNLVYLPQFVQIFGGSILENLRVFAQGASTDRLMAASARTGLQALVDTLPMGYRTLLPPGGRNLSGGQRQLIALTGALASGRALLLLDEAMANLDALRALPLRRLVSEGDWTVVAAHHAPLAAKGD